MRKWLLVCVTILTPLSMALAMSAHVARAGSDVGDAFGNGARKAGGEMQAAAMPLVWMVDGMQRIRPDDPAGSAAHIDLFAARGEFEPFQIIVQAPQGGLTGVDVEASDLTGAGDARISHDYITLYREHYIFLEQGSSDWGGSNRPEGSGWYPEPLIPFVHPLTGLDLSGFTLDAVPFDLESGRNQPVWVDVYVPRDSQAGSYSGTFRVTSQQGTAEVTVTLNVWDFELPLKSSLPAVTQLWNSSGKATSIELLKHKFTPYSVGTAQERELIDEFGLSVQSTPFWSGNGYGDCNSMPPPPEVDRVRQEATRHQSDLVLFAHYADEIQSCPNIFPDAIEWAKALRQGGVKPLLPASPLPGLIDDGYGNSAADIWVLLPVMFERYADNIRQIRERGGEVWSYNALVQDAYSPKWTVDFAPINFRIQPGFISYSLGLTGLLYWVFDYWTTDPWNDVTRMGDRYPGDGVFVYPGNVVGIDGALGGMRLKWIREGVEDLQYLTLLKELGEGQLAKEVAERIGPDWMNWTRSTDELYSARRALGDEIERLTSSSGRPIFADVPFSHPYHDVIELLYQGGYTAGCNTNPLRYCPEATMNRAESSVFVERGIHTASYDPPSPASQVFADMPLDSWAAKWVTGLWNDQYTAGCGTYPLVYCPWHGHTRAEGCVYYLRMMRGATYEPPQPAQPMFADVPLEAWYAKWVQAAYDAGLITACQTTPDLRFCPDGPLTRALAAYMMVQAKGLH